MLSRPLHFTFSRHFFFFFFTFKVASAVSRPPNASSPSYESLLYRGRTLDSQGGGYGWVSNGPPLIVRTKSRDIQLTRDGSKAGVSPPPPTQSCCFFLSFWKSLRTCAFSRTRQVRAPPPPMFEGGPPPQCLTFIGINTLFLINCRPSRTGVTTRPRPQVKFPPPLWQINNKKCNILFGNWGKYTI